MSVSSSSSEPLNYFIMIFIVDLAPSIQGHGVFHSTNISCVYYSRARSIQHAHSIQGNTVYYTLYRNIKTHCLMLGSKDYVYAILYTLKATSVVHPNTKAIF